ncbi:MAG: serine/threonine-protein kinase [Candidatus Polarisedimenticolia bacterium]
MPISSSRIDRYELQEIIGRGAMGVVYLARDPVIGRVVALKTIQIPEGTSEQARGTTIERFAREARAAGVLAHPNIVTIYDVGFLEAEGGDSYIAMEFVEGRTLRQMVPHGERLDPEVVLDYAQQLARGLEYAHQRGVVHRDIKPANILVRDDGLVKLADFGVAHMDSSELTRTGQSVGSPSYIAPEMLMDQDVDGRTDLFSLGVVLYELLTGIKPFRADSMPALYHQILSADPLPPSRFDPDIPPEWDAVLVRLLAKSREHRYPSAAHLLEDLRAMQGGRPLRFVTHESAPEVLELADASPLPEPVPDRVIEDGLRDGGPARGRNIAPHFKALAAVVTLGGFALVIILAASVFRGDVTHGPGPAAGTAAAAPLPRPAGLDLQLQHNLRSGRIGITMDGQPILTESFKGERARMRVQGKFSRSLEVSPGNHVFKVTVADVDGRSWSGVIRRQMRPGSRASLRIEVKGLLKKNLELSWI